MTVHTKSNSAGQPKGLRPGGKPQRLVDFFEANPHEELTYRDIAAKLDVTYDGARTMVSRLCKAGDIEVVHIVRLRRHS